MSPQKHDRDHRVWGRAPDALHRVATPPPAVGCVGVSATVSGSSRPESTLTGSPGIRLVGTFDVRRMAAASVARDHREGEDPD
jgi:hypothetical protein